MHDPKVLDATVKMIRTLQGSLGRLGPAFRERLLLLHERAEAHKQDGKPWTIAAGDIGVITLALKSTDCIIEMPKALEFLEPVDETPKA